MLDLNNYQFTVSQKKILEDIKKDLFMWNETPFEQLWPKEFEIKYEGKQLAKKIFEYYTTKYKELQIKPNNYDNFQWIKYKPRKYSFTKIEKEGMGLGMCPVASEGTRCCNLLTLDAVESCGFDCSYCSIQSFYNQNKIGFDKDFKTKLENLNLDPNEIYHIGTGQSSDSLMWGNREGILDALFSFAKKYPNVILEFKTKSNNIKYFIENDVPPNIIVTWSLNPQVIIDNEEHLTASLEERINAARKLADRDILVGFHFHPIVVYENYLDDYTAIAKHLTNQFTPKEVALISMGTLTFIKPVIKKIREREFQSKILQMPFETINGKQSYPIKTKKEMFKTLYDAFEPWHRKVYFYMCMEAHSLWKDVFGYEYSSNNQMEEFMKNSYMEKIENLSKLKNK
ncbi:MAG: hypothetical protein IE909_02865 [Campylobacterales bacterium]|nr:hypothetical protein [Campylobacterales bacterium]